MDDNRKKALGAALTQIERQFGKGAIMRLGDPSVMPDIDVVSTGSLQLDVALGVGGLPRGRVVEIYGPEASGKTTLALEVIAQMQAEEAYTQWLQGEPEAQLARVLERHPERLENERLAVEPRRLAIQISKDANYDFDIYRMANLTFTLTEQETGQSYTSSRIDFQSSTGVSGVTVPPGSYKLVIPRMNNWSPGTVVVQPSDPNRLTIRIRLQRGGQVRLTRS